MKISNLFNSGKTVFSFEVFPPKKTSPIESVYGKLEEISALKPDFISVTYSAGGSGSKSRTCEIATKIKRDFGVESVAHLTCINSTKADIDRNLALFKENGIENILALRGDRVEGVEPQKDFAYASDLCRYIASQGDFDIAGACYPEVHSEATDEVEDIHNLRKKVESGASHLISQLFFDNSVYYRFLERAKIAGVNVPIEAGIMPVQAKVRLKEWFQCAVQAFLQNLQRLCRSTIQGPRHCVTQALHMRLTRLLTLSHTVLTASTSTQ